MARRIEVEAVGDIKSLQRAFGRGGSVLKTFGKEADRQRRPMRALGLGLAGLAASYLSIGAAKSAIETTIGLTKTTIALNRNLGLSVEVASQWAASAKARGVDTNALSASFTNLSKNVEAALDGTKSAKKAFGDLGISQKELRSTGGDFNKVLDLVADALGGMEGGTKRAALAQKLLGRSSQTTLPIFTAGKKAMRESLELADKYGVTLGGKPLKNLRDLQRAQREMEFAQLGWQVTFATQIAPALAKFIELINKVNVFLQEHKTIAKVVAIALLALAAGLAVLSVAATIAATTLAALWVVAGVGVIVALAAAVVIAYKRFETFRNVVDAVIGFVKDHWKILLGVFGLIFPVIVKIIERWGDIKRVGIATFEAIRDPIRKVIGAVETLIGWIENAIGAIGRLAGAIRSIPTPSLPSRGRGVPFIPGFQHGGVMPHTGLAYLHRGERVIPAGRNGGGLTVNFNGPVFGAERDLETIMQRAFVRYQQRNNRTFGSR